MKPEAQPRHRQDSQQHKDALGRTTPKGDRADSESLHEGFTGTPLIRARATPNRPGRERLAASCGAVLEMWNGSAMARPGTVSVNHPS